MSSSEGGDDGAERTEQPTDRRLERAFEGGEFQFPRDTFIFAHIVVGLILFVATPGLLIGLKPLLLRAADLFRNDHPPIETIAGTLEETIGFLSWALGLMMGIFLIVAIVVGFGQQGFRLALRPLKASLSNVSPVAGLKRVFGFQALLTNGLNLVKLVLVTVIVGMTAYAFAGPVAFVANLAAVDVLPQRAVKAMTPLLVSCAVALLIFAAVDYGLKYFQTRRQLRMTKQEIKEEYKESEGDPHVKARLARLRRERRQNSSYALREADMVLVNPTHYSVALKYESAKHAAPIVIAKGAGEAALRIRTEARQWGIPVLRYPEVTRGLFFRTGIDEEIPENLFEEVARILVLVMNMRRPGRF